MTDKKTDEHLASDLRIIIGRLVNKFRSKSTATGQLSMTERSVIKLLDQHKELLPSELATIENITTQSMSQIISHLSALGYINRKISDTDKRKAIISLSDAGLEMLYNSRHERDEWLTKAIADTCSAAEQELLRQCLAPLNRLIDYE